MNEEEADKTPRVCGACGGTSILPQSEELEPNPVENDCPWCSGGYQDGTQQTRWRSFRIAMSKISGTYSAFEDLIKMLLLRLRELGRKGEHEALTLYDEGEKCLQNWVSSAPTTDERTEATNKLLAFNRKGLDYLQKKK